MQVTRPEDMTEEFAEEAGKLRKELFTGSDEADLVRAMDRRLNKLEKKKEVLVRRYGMSTEEIPEEVGSLVSCILSEAAVSHKRHLKKQAIQMIRAL